MSFDFPRLTASTDASTSAVSVLDKPASPLATSPATSSLSLGRASQSLLFVDASVSNYQQLVAGASPGTEVHVLDPVQDAVTQITNTLLGRSGISSMQIVSHGESGGLDFGSSRLNLADLPGYAAQVQSWGKALTDDADILLYGCNVAQGELGKTFVNLLSQVTGADVAASDNLTGRGGDWTLEYQTGSIEASSALTASAEAAYNGTLATITVTTASDAVAGDFSVSLREAINSINAGADTSDVVATGAYGTNDTIVFSGPIFSDTTPDTIALTTGAVNITRSVTIQGLGADVLTISGNNASRVFKISSGATVNIDGLAIVNARNLADGGGGIRNEGTLNLSNSVISNNQALYGGGIGNYDGATATITSTTFSGNTAQYGGGFDNSGTVGSTATISNSAFINNNAQFEGGGISSDRSTLTATNLTIGNNTAGTNGAGVRITNGSTATLTNLTITGNTAPSSGGGLYVSGATTTATVRNSIIANSGASGDVSGSITGDANNLIGILTGGSGTIGTGSDLVGANPLLSALGSYGGVTPTYALLPGSAAINAGTSSGAPTTDQRGIARVGAVDIGAFESRGFTATLSSGNNQSAPRNTAFTPLAVTVSSAFSEPVNGGIFTFTAPATGASTTPATQTVTIASGQATANETANAVLGSYNVIASANGSTSATFSLTNTNRLPVVNGFGKATNQDTPIAFQSSDFTSKFSDADPSDSLTSIRITALPTNGSLLLNGVAVTANTDLPVAQLGNLTYSPKPGYNGNDSFSWSGSDGTNYAPEGATVALAIAPTGVTPVVPVVPPVTPSVTEHTANDYDGDGKADLLITHANYPIKGTQPTSITYSLRLSSSSTVLEIATLSSNFELVATGDFNGDGNTDLLWKNTANNTYSEWLLNRNTYTGGGTIATLSSNFGVAYSADYNGDGCDDILWRNSDNNTYSTWFLSGNTYVGGGTIATVAANFQLVGTGDYNGDGKADLLWKDTNTNSYSNWFLSGNSYIGGGIIATLSGNFSVAYSADYNGDGCDDILWRDSNSNSYSNWFLSGNTYIGGGTIATLPVNFEVVASRDYNGDGDADVVWVNKSNGALSQWFLEDFTYIGGGDAGSLGSTEAVRR